MSLEPMIFQDRILWTGHLCGKLVRPCNLQIHASLCQGENLSGKLMPRAVALRCCMIEPVRVRTSKREHLLSNFSSWSWRDYLAIHNSYFSALPRQLQHQLNEVQSTLCSARTPPINRRRSKYKVLVRGCPHEM